MGTFASRPDPGSGPFAMYIEMATRRFLERAQPAQQRWSDEPQSRIQTSHILDPVPSALAGSAASLSSPSQDVFPSLPSIRPELKSYQQG